MRPFYFLTGYVNDAVKSLLRCMLCCDDWRKAMPWSLCMEGLLQCRAAENQVRKRMEDPHLTFMKTTHLFTYLASTVYLGLSSFDHPIGIGAP
jgi:arylamine N-acetyltransferase